MVFSRLSFLHSDYSYTFLLGFATFMRRLEMYFKWSHCCLASPMMYILTLEYFLRRLRAITVNAGLHCFVLSSCIPPIPMMSPLLERSLPRSTMCEKKSGLKLTAKNMLACGWILLNFNRTLCFRWAGVKNYSVSDTVTLFRWRRIGQNC